jgi:hypothetical protein
MLCLGIMGEYLGRVYAQSRQRPLFVIRSVQTDGPAVEKTEESREFICSK